jgi:hypothetical protein
MKGEKNPNFLRGISDKWWVNSYNFTEGVKTVSDFKK